MRGTAPAEEREPFEILARGPWAPSQLVSRRVARAVVREPAATAALEAAWRRAQERARASGQTLYPGRIYGVAAWRVAGPRLELDLHETDYGEFVATNCAPDYLKFARETASRSDALGISVLLISGSRIVFHRRGARVYEWPLAIDTPGGHVEPGTHDDRESGQPSPFAAARDELESELGLAAQEIRGLHAIGLTRIADTEKPQLVFAARIDLAPDELAARAAAARESFETSAICPVAIASLAELELEAAAVARDATRPALLTPAGRAAVRLARGGLDFLPP